MPGFKVTPFFDTEYLRNGTRYSFNCFPQGSVLALVLFNLYSNYLPVTRGRKFIYTDYICLAIQCLAIHFSELECSFSSDMAWMSHFRRQWWLKPSASKTISSVFRLHNTCAARELSVYLDGQRLQYECHPSYLEVTLDRTLSTENMWQRLQVSWRTETTCWWASWFHLRRQRQHSAVLCSGALFSSRVLRPSLVTLCSQRSGQCAVELYHAPHLWYPLFYTSPMASSALQHW